MDSCGGCCLPLFGSKKQPEQKAPRLVVSDPPPRDRMTSSILLAPQRQTKLVQISAFDDPTQAPQQVSRINVRRSEAQTDPTKASQSPVSSPRRRGGMIPHQPKIAEGQDTQAGSPAVVARDRTTDESSNTAAIFSSFGGRTAAGDVINQNAPHITGKSDPMTSVAGTLPKVDTTANEDCDVDVEEDIPFVAPELLWGIKEMLARVEIQNLRNKQDGKSESPAQRELGHHYSHFMQAIGNVEQQTNRGFDWLSILKKDAPDNAQTSNAGAKLELGQLFSQFKFAPDLTVPDQHPLAKRKTGRTDGMMPSAIQVNQSGLESPPKSSALNSAALKQVNRLDRQAFDEVKKDARDLADEFNLDDMSFAA